jgi:indole-3-glycerol phosphate synthase
VRGTRRFSQAISEGDGISVIVEVGDAEAARAAEAQGAEGLVVRRPLEGLRDATALPILWSAQGPLEDALAAGADACLLDFDRHEDGGPEAQHARALELGLDCVVRVRDEEELEDALERLDPEILLLSARGERDGEGELEGALDLLPDVPAGKLAIAEVPVAAREDVDALERAGVDAVIVGSTDVAGLVGGRLPDA